MVDHTHLHSPASAAGEVYTNPFIYRLPAINWVDDQADEMLVDRCSSVTLRDHAPGLSANLRPMNIDLVAETSSVVNKLDDLRQCTNTHWPAIVQESQPSRTRSSSPENFFSDRTKCPATPIKIQVRSGAPFSYQGDDQKGASTSTFDQYMPNLCQSYSSPIRTAQSPRRFDPYGISRAREPGQQNAQAGPLIIHIPSALQPIREAIPEINQPITRDGEAPKPKEPKRTRGPNGTGRPRPCRKLEQESIRELCNLVKQWKDLNAVPGRKEALRYILEYIKTVRVPVYNKTRLATREAEQNPKPSEQAKQERERRLEERKILAQLSRYYLLGSDEDEDAGDDGLEEVWERPPLLREVLKDMKVRYPPPGLSNNSAP